MLDTMANDGLVASAWDYERALKACASAAHASARAALGGGADRAGGEGHTAETIAAGDTAGDSREVSSREVSSREASPYEASVAAVELIQRAAREQIPPVLPAECHLHALDAALGDGAGWAPAAELLRLTRRLPTTQPRESENAGGRERHSRLARNPRPAQSWHYKERLDGSDQFRRHHRQRFASALFLAAAQDGAEGSRLRAQLDELRRAGGQPTTQLFEKAFWGCRVSRQGGALNVGFLLHLCKSETGSVSARVTAEPPPPPRSRSAQTSNPNLQPPSLQPEPRTLTSNPNLQP